MSSDPIQQAQNAANAMKTIVDLAADHPEFKQAGTNLAKSAKTITALIDNVLLPIAVVNFAFDRGKKYFEQKFPKDLAAVSANIPEENLVEPKASVAAPILQGLIFAHEEIDLKRLFLNLLGSAMDSRKAEEVHPAFAEVIRQLNSQEARIITGILSAADVLPIVNIRIKLDDGKGYIVVKSNVMGTFDSQSGKPIVISRFGSMVDNWMRLGLISTNYLEMLMAEGQYDWVDTWPEYVDTKQSHMLNEIEFQKGILRVTNFGRDFFRAVA